jgi:hypothetical protein
VTAVAIFETAAANFYIVTSQPIFHRIRFPSELKWTGAKLKGAAVV